MAFGIIKADTLTHSTAGSLDTKFAVNGSVKMWSSVQSDQATQNDSFNVSSTSDEGTGACRRNLTSAFSANPFNNAGLSVEQYQNAGFSQFSSVSTSAVQTTVKNTSNSVSNHANTCLAIGDLA